MSATPDGDPRPILTFDLAHDIRTFPAFDYLVSQSDVARYTKVTGDFNTLYSTVIPPGFAGVFGRPGARYELLASLNDAGGWDFTVREEGTETVCVSASAARSAGPT